MELIPDELAAQITSALTIPTIGIGAGAGCDGQVLVTSDLLGLRPDRKPLKHVRQYASIGEQIAQALQQYREKSNLADFLNLRVYCKQPTCIKQSASLLDLLAENTEEDHSMSVPPPESNIPPYVGGTPGTATVTQDDKMMAMLAYLLGIVTGFLGPLIIWLIKKDQSKFIAFHALQALLLHAVVLVGYILSSFLVIMLIGFLTYPAFFILGLVYSILAGMAANRGEWYDIPVIGKIAHQQAGV